MDVRTWIDDLQDFWLYVNEMKQDRTDPFTETDIRFVSSLEELDLLRRMVPPSIPGESLPTVITWLVDTYL